MKQRMIYLFNPENDLALANGDANYMAPTSALQMASDLALLPIWYADPGNSVLAASAYNFPFLRTMKEQFPLKVELITEPELPVVSDAMFSPWGWNPALVKHLSSRGVHSGSLPSDIQLQTITQLSHRQRAVELLPLLQIDKSFCGESAFLTQAGEWKEYIESRQSCLLKAPLSGSGKGLNWCRGVFTPSISGWCSRTSVLQGGVIAEPIYNKVEDFAMEFFVDQAGTVTFAGYSLFSTGSRGAYEKSFLLADAEIEKRLSCYVPVEALHRLRMRIEKELKGLLGGGYHGYLGIDMMICKFEEEPSYRIHPCVEINLRMNMGVVSRLLYDRLVHPDAAGEFHITYHSRSGEALAIHERMLSESPLKQHEGRILSGYLSLTPITKHSHYRAWVFIGLAERQDLHSHTDQ